MSTATTTISSTSRSSPLPPRPAPHHRLWSALVRHAQDHHASVNAAYAAYYGPGNKTTATTGQSLRSSSSASATVVDRKMSSSSSSSSTYLSSSSSSLYSMPRGKETGKQGEEEEEEVSIPKAASSSSSLPRKYAGQAWRAVKRHAREHHESVQASYVALHGR